MKRLAPTFDSLNFDNRFVAELPADPVAENSCRQVRDALYSRVNSYTVRRPELRAYSSDVLGRLSLGGGWAQNAVSQRTMAGNRLAPGMQSYASCYGGHQFGHW